MSDGAAARVPRTSICRGAAALASVVLVGAALVAVSLASAAAPSSTERNYNETHRAGGRPPGSGRCPGTDRCVPTRLCSRLMVVCSPSAFADAVDAHPFDDFAFDVESLNRSASSVADAGMVVVGEPHGIRETPSVLYALGSALGTRAVAFEWSHEEMNRPVQEFLENGSFNFERLWSLPASAEFFCGDGRIAAGHFALLRRLWAEGRLDQVIVFDRLDPEPPEDWHVREKDMADRLLSEWDGATPLLALTGAFHAQAHPESQSMTTHLCRARPGLLPAMLDYTSGYCWSRGELHDVSGAMPEAPTTLRLPEATPAVVPGPTSS